jgi:hypothetical protein
VADQLGRTAKHLKSRATAALCPAYDDLLAQLPAKPVVVDQGPDLGHLADLIP